MKSEEPKVGIVILNYQNWQDTTNCLGSVLVDSYCNRVIIVVDNGSGDESLQNIETHLGRQGIRSKRGRTKSELGSFGENDVLLVQVTKNRGYAAGNNAGMRLALEIGCEYVLILNNDTLVQRGYLTELVRFAESTPGAGLLGPALYRADGKFDIGCMRRRPRGREYFLRMGILGALFPVNSVVAYHYYADKATPTAPREADILGGACMLFRKDLLDEIGLLDERTFLYLEEFIVHERMRFTRWKTYVVPSSVVIHLREQSMSRTPSRFRLSAEMKSLMFYLKEYRRFPWLVRALVRLNMEVRYVPAKIREFMRSHRV